jgi:hypothetical protein
MLCLSLTGTGTAIFWVLFFATDALQTSTDRCYLAWERSFPLADAWMGGTALLAAWGLWRGRAWGWGAALVFGGASVFLGLIDVLFFLQHGLYTPVNADVLLELGIHGWALGFGGFSIIYAWRALAGVVHH